MTLHDDLAKWFSENTFSENTVARYQRAISVLIDEKGEDLTTLTAQDLKAHLNRPDWGDSHRWINYCAIKGFIRWRYGATHPALLLRMKRQESGPQRSLTLDQVTRLLASFDTTTKKGIRDLALCALALDTGLRCSELCNLETRHLNLPEQTLSAKIKGSRWEHACYSNHTTRYLENWLSIRETEAEDNLRTVFCSLGGLTPGKQLTREGLTVIVRNWGTQAGIQPLSPHDLRRTFAVLSTEAGAPSRLLQIAGRWKDIKMVERYTRNLQLKDFIPYLPLNSVMEKAT